MLTVGNFDISNSLAGWALEFYSVSDTLIAEDSVPSFVRIDDCCIPSRHSRTIAMIDRMCHNFLRPIHYFLLLSMTMPLASGADFPARKIPEGNSVRERFLKLVDRPQVPLDAHATTPLVADGLAELRFHFASEKDQIVPGMLVKQANLVTPRPAIIVLHGTGGSKESLRPLLRQLASRGFVAVAIDARFAGERATGTQGPAQYHAAITKTWQTGQGFPFLYDTVWDIFRLLDYLQTREDVTNEQIGAIGFSKGGIELYLAAAIDTRIVAAVPCIGVQSFKWGLDHNAWQSRISTIQPAIDVAQQETGTKTVDAAFVRRFYDRVVPGIYQEFDGPQMLPLIAPRSLLVINGELDDRTPLPGLEMCVEAAKKSYLELDASKQFEFIVQPQTSHKMTPQSEQYIIDWLTRRFLKMTGGGPASPK